MNNSERIHRLVALNQEKGLKLSLFLETYRTSPQNKQNQIVFKNLVNKATGLLNQKLGPKQSKDYTDRLSAMSNDLSLFEKPLDGLIIYMTQDDLEIIRLADKVINKVVVSDHLHLSPLISYENGYQRVLALDLSKDRFKLFEVDRYSQNEIKIEGVYYTFKELFDDTDTQSTLSFGSYKGDLTSYHGAKDVSDTMANDVEKYFRYIDSELDKQFKNDSRPLVVFATTENGAWFRDITKRKFDLVEKPLSSLTKEEVLKEVTEILAKKNETLLQNLDQRVDIATSQRLLSNHLDAISKDLEVGKVEMIQIKDEFDETYDELVNEALTHKVRIHFNPSLQYQIIAINHN